MPSYRTIKTVTTLAPGRAPEEVEAAARSVTRLESWDIAIASGQPRVTARFTATDEGYRTKRVGFMVTFRLFGAEKSVLKLVGANLKDGQNVLVL